VNSGIYCFDLKPLFNSLDQLAADNAQGEYYLTDLVSDLPAAQDARGNVVSGFARRVARRQLAAWISQSSAPSSARARTAKSCSAGVTLEDAATTYIDVPVSIGADTIIGPGVELQGTTTIGEGCRIHAGMPDLQRYDWRSRDGARSLRDCGLALWTPARASARWRTFDRNRKWARTHTSGNFVELKKTKLGKGSKANHLAYLGDATIGERANIGAGTITCNYDGVAKHPTNHRRRRVSSVRIHNWSRRCGSARVRTSRRVVHYQGRAGRRARHRQSRQQNIPDWAAARRAKRAKGHD
jgi:bifunctional UDP-N-acetylglucosamine pyrophosphorylase/glucosamine-1-phosphate N-acetyltransferase